MSDPDAQPGNEAVPVPFADGAELPRAEHLGAKQHICAYFATDAERRAWSDLPLWEALAAWEQALGMVLSTHLRAHSRCARGARFAATAHRSDISLWLHSGSVQGVFLDGVRLIVSEMLSRDLLRRVANLRELLLL